MSIAALFAWGATVLAGLALVVIWLMEYDRDSQRTAATRLPAPVISAHALLGVGGLLAWGLYLTGDDERLGLATVADLGVVIVLGLTMAARWLGVVRVYAAPNSSQTRVIAVPPERYFPRPVVVIHGLLAVATVVLVVFSVFFDGS